MSNRYAFIAVYMMTSRPFGPLYTGVTSNLIRRAYEHREGFAPGFTKKYGLKMLVWYEQHETMDVALQRETSLKLPARLEAEPDRADEPGLGGFVSNAGGVRPYRPPSITQSSSLFFRFPRDKPEKNGEGDMGA